MERATSKSYEDFPPCTLYLADVAELLDMLSKTCKQIKYSAGEYTSSDASELEVMAAKFPAGRFIDLKLQGYEPYLSLEFRSFEVRAYLSEESNELAGLLARVRNVLDRRRKRPPGLWVTVLAGLAFAVAVGVGTYGDYVAGGLIALSAVFLTYLAIRITFRNNVVVRTEERIELKPFLARKKDDLLLAIGSALLGAAASYALTKYLQ